jgi:DNA-binding NtrC family response regulator
MSRILVIDSDMAASRDIQTILQRDGFDIVVAQDARQGIAAIQADRFDMVIVDIFMAGMDGLETIGMFRKHAPRVPIIAISGFMFRDSATPAPDFLSMATKLGAADSLAKPFAPTDLLRAVKCCLGQQDEPVALTDRTGAPISLTDPTDAAIALATQIETQIANGTTGEMASGEPGEPQVAK